MKKLKIFFKDFQGSFSNALWFYPYLSTILDAFVEIVNTFRQYFFVFFSVQNVSSNDMGVKRYYGSDAVDLIEMYSMLNSIGRRRVHQYMMDISDDGHFQGL